MESTEKIDKWIEALNKSDFDGLGITRMTREAKDMLVRDMEDWKEKIHELDERVAIQSPDVVRCRDCKHAELHKWEGHEAIYCTCHEEPGYDHEPEHPLDWFCADGEWNGNEQDALAMLKEQQPRVLSLREIAGKEAVWNEWSSVDGFVECMLFYREDAVDYIFAESNGAMLYFDKAEYGLSWRCWDKRPTVEQMHDEQWENR